MFLEKDGRFFLLHELQLFRPNLLEVGSSKRSILIECTCHNLNVDLIAPASTYSWSQLLLLTFIEGGASFRAIAGETASFATSVNSRVLLLLLILAT